MTARDAVYTREQAELHVTLDVDFDYTPSERPAGDFYPGYPAAVDLTSVTLLGVKVEWHEIPAAWRKAIEMALGK